MSFNDAAEGIEVERRNSLEITAKILEIAETGAKKSHVAYGANLNHSLLEQYLNRLEEQGLITRNIERERKVQATKKGTSFLQQYRRLLRLQYASL